MKLYIKKDYKTENEIEGIIFNKVRNVKDEIFIYFTATKDEDLTTITLQLRYGYGTDKVVQDYILEKDYEIEFNLKSILYWVENHIKNIWRIK